MGEVKPFRLMSLDALRGFDMFLIMSGDGLVCALLQMFGMSDFHLITQHAPWHGLWFHDTIAPLFLFMVGVSFPFSHAASKAKGLGDGQILAKAIRRCLILILLGLVESKCRMVKLGYFHFSGMLQLIAVSSLHATVAFLRLKARARIVLVAAVAAFMTVFPLLVCAPDAPPGADAFSPAGNIGQWLDRLVWGSHCAGMIDGVRFENSGFGALPMNAVIVMLGMFAGEILLSGGREATARKAMRLLGAAAVCGALGSALSFVCPVNKTLATPSFALVTGAYSFAMLALFYWVIDVRGFRRWAQFFTVIGVNSIFAYMFPRLVSPKFTFDMVFRYYADMMPKVPHDIFVALVYVMFTWIFLWFLDRRKIYFKV